jgi:hypothetical protein
MQDNFKYPYWQDGCKHKRSEFIGGFESYSRNDKIFKRYDLYLFKAKYYGTEACIRYGNEPYEYISPGPITLMALHTQDDVYFRALELINRSVTLRYKKRSIL